MDLGAWIVRGRSRVPCPPTRRSAFISKRDDTALQLWPDVRHTINLPNTLTATRIFLVPLLVVVLLTNFEGRLIFGVRKELIGAAIFGLASITDWLDGYLARPGVNTVTTFGQMIDPIADKLLTRPVRLADSDGLAPAWMVAVIIGRELAVTTLRSIAYARGVVIPASPLGKTKMVAQVVAILALILGEEERLRPLGLVGYAALWVVVATALISAVDYYRRFSRIQPKVATFPPVEQPRSKASAFQSQF